MYGYLHTHHHFASFTLFPGVTALEEASDSHVHDYAFSIPDYKRGLLEDASYAYINPLAVVSG